MNRRFDEKQAQEQTRQSGAARQDAAHVVSPSFLSRIAAEGGLRFVATEKPSVTARSADTRGAAASERCAQFRLVPRAGRSLGVASDVGA